MQFLHLVHVKDRFFKILVTTGDEPKAMEMALFKE